MGFRGTGSQRFQGWSPASPASIYINNGSQLKLRPRAVKDLLHTSKSKLGHRVD